MSKLRILKPPVFGPDETNHRHQIAEYTRDCLHKSGITPFNGLAGIGYTPATLSTSQNDYDPGPFSIVRVQASTPVSITGFTEVFPGRFLWIINVGTSNITLANQSASSLAENRIITGTGGGVILGADAHAVLWYDDTSQRWRAWA